MFVDLIVPVMYICVILAQCVVAYNLIKQNKELRKEAHYKQLEVNVCLMNMKRMATYNQELERENEELDDENESLSEECDALESFMADVYTTIYAEHQKKKKIKNLQRKIKNKEKK